MVETLAEGGYGDITVTCRDLDENGLRRGRELARGCGLANIRYERGNALDEAGLLALEPQPTLIVASGFYEILMDDALIREQMRIDRQALASGGALIFTTQVNHPQLELIARTLYNREGKPWVMKNRPVAQTERWALDAGFASVRSVLAPTGLYAITVASKA
jgi:hypothetical protein